MLIYVAGIPGVGKTTVIKSLVEKLNSTGNKALPIGGLPILCKLAGDISPEEFRKLPDSIREQYRPEMFKIIYEEDLNDPKTTRILDGHFAYYEAGGKEYSTRPIQKGDYTQMKAIFVITASSENIIERRKKDNQERTDRTLELEHIIEQEKIENNEALKQASELNIPLVFLSNNSTIDNAVHEIYFELEKLKLFQNEIKHPSATEIKLR